MVGIITGVRFLEQMLFECPSLFRGGHFLLLSVGIPHFSGDAMQASADGLFGHSEADAQALMRMANLICCRCVGINAVEEIITGYDEDVAGFQSAVKLH